MNWKNLAVILTVLILMAAPALYILGQKHNVEKDLKYALAERDSVIASKVYSDTTHLIEVKHLQELLGRKPAVIYKATKPDTVFLPNTDVARLDIDTTLNTTDLDSNKYKIPFVARVDFANNFFDYDFKVGTIKEKEIIHNNSVVNKPPIIIEPSFWDNAQKYAIGGGVVAIVVLVFNSVK